MWRILCSGVAGTSGASTSISTSSSASTTCAADPLVEVLYTKSSMMDSKTLDIGGNRCDGPSNTETGALGRGITAVENDDCTGCSEAPWSNADTPNMSWNRVRL